MVRSKLSLNAWFFILLLTGFVILGLVFLSHPHWQFKNKMGGKRLVEHTAIASIDLWGRTRFNGAPSELIRVELKDGEKIDFNGWYYRNLPELKRALEANYRELLTAPPENHVRPGLSADPKVFSGTVLTSLKGILFYGLLIGAIILCISWRDVIIVPLVFFPPILVIFGVQLYYFRLRGDELEIRNHVAPWYRKSYPLTNIAGVMLEDSYSRWSRTMRVRTYDHHSDGYPAGTLRKRDWQALARALKNRGIHVNTQNLGK